MKKDFFRYEEAGMIDEEGRFLGFVPEESGIWVPAPILAPEYNLRIEQVHIQNVGIVGDPCLIFFVPDDWVVRGVKAGWKTRLKDKGWILKNDTRNLLGEFVKLADAKPDKYLQFARKWGPLWDQVREPFKESYTREPQPEKMAPWAESTEIWRIKAKEVKGFLDIAAYLHQGKPAPFDLWKSIPTGLEEQFKNDITRQRRWISLLLTHKISDEHQVWFHFDWSGEQPALQLTTKLGFIHSVWFQLLQAVSKMQVCVCDGCGKVYVREGRKPARGRNNFCPECGDKASKKLWAEKNKK